MKRNEYVKFIQANARQRTHVKQSVTPDKSVTDPTFARTGRQLIFQPLNIEYRMKYPQGVPLNPDNPLEFAEYDKLYPDTFKAMRDAKADVQTTNENLTKADDKYKQQQQQKQQN